MKAITLWQPWASLVRPGLKTIETHSWTTDYRGEIAIHAAKKWTPDLRQFAEKARQDLEANGLLPPPDPLPLGAIVAVARLVDSRWMETAPDPINEAFGRFGQGRAGWVFEDIRVLPEPIPCSGAQGLWFVNDNRQWRIRQALAEPLRPDAGLPLFPSTAKKGAWRG